MCCLSQMFSQVFTGMYFLKLLYISQIKLEFLYNFHKFLQLLVLHISTVCASMHSINDGLEINPYVISISRMLYPLLKSKCFWQPSCMPLYPRMTCLAADGCEISRTSSGPCTLPKNYQTTATKLFAVHSCLPDSLQ